MVEILGVIFMIFLGTIGHFIYDWSNHNKLLGHFFAVNESTWEHLKLIMGPSLLWFIVELHIYTNNGSLYFVKFITLLFMLLFIPVIFYTYKSFTKKPILAIDISSFMLAIILGETLFHFLIKLDFSNLILRHIGIIGLTIIFIKYVTGTFAPNKNFIYKDPITNKYGVKGHSKIEHHEHK